MGLLVLPHFLFFFFAFPLRLYQLSLVLLIVDEQILKVSLSFNQSIIFLLQLPLQLIYFGGQLILIFLQAHHALILAIDLRGLQFG